MTQRGNPDLELTTASDETLNRLGMVKDFALGISCPKCGCKHLLTDSTARSVEEVRRYKICRNCGKRVRTVERQG